MAKTNTKYLIEFNSIKTSSKYLLKIIDQINEYDAIQYPRYLTGTQVPVEKSYNNSNDSPYTPILASQLDVMIILDKNISPNDFSQATDRQWKVEYYKDGNLDFQGWLISSEIRQSYTDAPRQFKLTAVDGLSTLKGKPLQQVTHIFSEFVDTFVVNPLPFYGLYKFTDFLFFCLYKLGYNYATTTIFTSLRFVDNGDSSQPVDWSKVLLWADQFFDDSGEPDDCYSVLEKILKSFGLQIVQEKGSFYIRHPNDSFYIGNIAQQEVVGQSSVEFDYLFSTVSDGYVASNFQIGFDVEAKPVNPDQMITYDVAYNKIRGKVTFKTAAYVYPDPGFEYAPVGGLPINFVKDQSINAFIVEDFNNAYQGSKFLRMQGTVADGSPFGSLAFIGNTGGSGIEWLIEAGKVVSLSLVFKAYEINGMYNSVPQFGLLYFINNKAYFFEYDVSNQWIEVESLYTKTYANIGTRDFVGYTQFNFTTPPTPGTGVGSLYLRLYNPTYSKGGNRDDALDPSKVITIDIDQLQISVKNAAEAYSKLVGEVHQAANNTNYALAEVNETEFDLYTGSDKRLTGSVLYGTDYINSVSSPEMWLYKLSYPNALGGFRLTEALVFQYEKMYQRPMMFFDGDIFTDNFSILNVPILRFYESKRFIILSAKIDYRNSIVTLKIRELNDVFFDYTYKYIPNFEKSARKVVN